MKIKNSDAMPPEPTLEDFLYDLWRAKAFLLAGAVLGIFFAVIFLALAVPHYRASMLAAPKQPLPGLAVAADSAGKDTPATKNMSPGETVDFMAFEHILRGPSVAEKLLADKRAIKGLREDRKFHFQGDSTNTQSPAALSAYLEKHVAIEPVGNTPLCRLVYQHPNREFAVYLLEALYQNADERIRYESMAAAKERAAYLENALEETDHPDHRQALTSLLMQQEQAQIVLGMDGPFAAIIAEPPASDAKIYWPRKSIILPVFMLCGMLFAYILFTLRRAKEQ